MFAALRWTSLGAAAFALAVHAAGFAVAVNLPALHIGMLVCGFILAVGGMLAHFPADTRTTGSSEGLTVEVQDSAWRYVPRWLRIAPGVVGLYAAAGLYLDAGVTEAHLTDMTPAVARWIAAALASLFLVAAGLYDGAASIRKHEFL